MQMDMMAFLFILFPNDHGTKDILSVCQDVSISIYVLAPDVIQLTDKKICSKINLSILQRHSQVSPCLHPTRLPHTYIPPPVEARRDAPSRLEVKPLIGIRSSLPQKFIHKFAQLQSFLNPLFVPRLFLESPLWKLDY